MVYVSLFDSFLSFCVRRENGGKGVRSGHHQELQQQQSVVQSTSSGSGSGSTAPATASVAMWTAISNPLLLISHVLRRSMDLQPTGATNNKSMMDGCEMASSQRQAADDNDVNDSESKVVNAGCECVSIERHAEPVNVDWQNQTIDQAPCVTSSRYDERKFTAKSILPILYVALNNSADARRITGASETVIRRMSCHLFCPGRFIHYSPLSL